ncbi:MAG: carboxypeptidase regulatory-like domain-containing protein [Terriglobales bacterium]
MKRSTLAVQVVLLIVSVVAFAVLAQAQFGASIEGTVTDKTGAVVAGANVVVTDQSTNVSHSTVSDAAGFYRVNELPPSTYRIEVQAGHFKKSSQSDVLVSAERPTPVNVTLDTGSASETVTVTGTQELLQTEDATIQGTMTAKEVEVLPEIDRDPYELIRLAPGVFGDGARFGDGRSAGFPNGAGAVSGSAGPGGSNTAIFQVENQQPISAMGQRITSNDYLVDGVSVNSLEWGGAAVITPSIETVQELNVLANDYDASDGRSSGAHIKTVTKSGTNALHGGGLFLYHDPNFNAYNKFGGYANGDFAAPLRDDDNLRQFAGTLGGPIIKNKLFFFFNYEGARANTTTFSTGYVETPQYDAALLALRPGTPVATILGQSGLTPRISQVLAPSCTGFATSPAPTCNVVGTGMDVGSPIGPYGTYDPTSQFSNGTGGGFDGIPDIENATVYLPATTSGNQYNARVDYNAGKNLFSANVYLTYLTTLAADASAQGRPNADYGTKNFSPSAFLSWIRTINPTTLNEARFNFTRYGFNGITANPQVDWAIPRIEIQGFPNGERIRYGAQQGDNTPEIAAENTFAFRDVFSKVMGNQAWKFGFEYSHEQDNDELIGGARPDQVFQGSWNFANGTPIFEQIEVNPITGGAPLRKPRYFRTSIYSAFAQNDWKLRPNLTVNLGLRWEYYAPPTEAKGNLTNFVPTSSAVNGLLDGSEINPSQQWNASWHNFGPRLGFAWSPTKYDNKLVFRGGFGIAYDRFDNNTFDNTRNNPPFVANYGICCGTSGGPFVNGQILFNTATSNSPLAYPGNPVLATGLGPNGLPIVSGPYSPPNIYSNPVNMPVPYVYLYSLQMQYSLPKDWVMTVGYQGSAGHHLTRIVNLAEFYPVPNPSVSQIFTFTPDTNTSFNALTAQFEHRFHHGVSANVLYTYSKSIDQLSAEGPGFVTNQTYPIDDHTERGPSDYDATHNFRAYGVWDLPIYRGRNDLMGILLGGWELNGIYQFHSGFPWTPVADNVCPVFGFINNCPIRPVGYLGGAGNNHETSAFLPPTSGNFPNGATSYFALQTTCGTPCLPDPPGIGRNTFRGPRYQDIDLSILKNFRLPTMKLIGEGGNIQLRMTAYNVFNKLNLAPFSFGSTSTTVSSNYTGSGASPLPNAQFGTATAGLAGRVLELQARFSF